MIKKYFIFIIGGGIGTLLYLLVVHFLVETEGLWYLWAYIVGSAVTITFNFLYHHKITFKVRKKSRGRFVKFASSSVVIGFVTIGLVYVLTDKLGVMYMLSGVVAVGIMSLINFLVNRFWIFQKETADQYEE
jgi:putative flippase GtrA